MRVGRSMHQSVTAIEPLGVFYPAEDDHANYYINHPSQSYCYYIIKPKMEKLKKVFSHKLKKDAH
jgi:peptide-methionine (S)-S-oxide reductase